MSQLRDRIFDSLNHRPIASISLALLTALACVFAQPGYRQFKRWRADIFFERSKELLAADSYQQAFDKAHTAILLSTHNIDACRHLAKLALRFNHPQAHRFWETVVRNERSNASDWAFAIDASFRNRDFATAFEYLSQWKIKGVEDHSGYELRRAQAYALAGQYGTALEVISSAMELTARDEEFRRLYLQLTEMIGSPETKTQTSLDILRNNSLNTFELEWIATQETVANPIRLKAIHRLLDLDSLNINKELDYINLGARLGSPHTSARIHSLESRLDLEDPTQLANFTTSLCQLGEYDRVTQLLEFETAKANRIQLRNLLIAQIEQGNAEETFELTSEQRSQRLTSIAEESLLRAIAFQQSGNPAQYRENLIQAIDSAELGDLAFLEQQFHRLGESQALFSLYRKVSAHPQLGHKARFLWLELAKRHKIEPEIMAALSGPENWHQRLLNPHQKAEVVYLQLVYGIRPGATVNAAREMAATFRHNLFFRHLLGLAHFVSGDIKTAKTLTSESPELDNPRLQLIGAVIHRRPLEADREKFLPGELALLEARSS